MTLSFSKKLLFPLLLLLLLLGASAEAQEGISYDDVGDTAAENLIEVEVEAFQSEALGNFLKDYRQILRQAKFNISVVLKKHKEDLKKIKQENFQTLKSISKDRLPKVVLKRIAPVKYQLSPSTLKATPPASPGPDFIFRGFLTKQNLKQRPQPRKKDRRLSLRERQRLGEIKKRRRQETLHFRQSEIGQLKTEIEEGSLKKHQAKLTQLSARIKKLLEQMKGGRHDNRKIFLDLGNAYLESQRYLNSLDYEEQIKLTRYAPHSGTALGSYELALWTYKVALTKNPNDGDTNFLMGKVFSEIGNQDEALERVRNAENLFIKNHDSDKAAETRSFIDSLLTSAPQNYRTEF